MAAALCIPVLVGALVAEVAAAELGEDRVAPAWTRYGTGEVSDLRLADLDADGTNEVLVGGRGVAAIDDDSLEDGRAQWTNKWPDVENVFQGGDFEGVLNMEVTDVTGDGIRDAIAATAIALHAIDGSTGETLWRIHEGSLRGDVQGCCWTLAVADFDGDGIEDVAYAGLVDERIRAVRGQDGSPLWTYPRTGAVTDLAAEDVNGDGFTDVVVVGGDGIPEVHAISGLAMEAGVAVPLWVQRFPGGLPPPPSGNFIYIGGDPSVVQVDDILPGGTPEVVVGGWGADAAVLDGGTGQVSSVWEFDGAVTDLEIVEIDGDPGTEIVLTNGSPDADTGTVEAWEGDGTKLWSHDVPGTPEDLEVADLDGDGDVEVVAVGSGPGGGYAAALEPSVDSSAGGSPLALWDRGFPVPAERVVIGEVFGVPSILVGHDPGGIHALGFDGRPLWFFRTGGHVKDVEVADLDADGSPQVVEAAGDAHVAVSDATGALEWARRVSGQGGSMVSEAATGDLTSDAGLEIAVGTFGGGVHAYSAAGDPLWQTTMPGLLGELLIEDLEADGEDDVVGATLPGQVARWRGDGELVWRSDPLPVGPLPVGVSVALAHAGGDDTRDVIVSPKPIFSGPLMAALDGQTGEELWRREPSQLVNWMSASADAAVVAVGTRAGVHLIDPRTGDPGWAVDLGSSGSGTWTVDVDSDGSRDLVVGLGDGHVVLLSGEDGAEIWRSRPGAGDSAAHVRIFRSGDVRRIAVGGVTDDYRHRSSIHVLELASGDVVGSLPTEAGVGALSHGDLDADGMDEVVAGAGWQVHAVRIGP